MTHWELNSSFVRASLNAEQSFSINSYSSSLVSCLNRFDGLHSHVDKAVRLFLPRDSISIYLTQAKIQICNLSDNSSSSDN